MPTPGTTKLGVYCNAGRENAVASTKAFTTQVTVLALLACWFRQLRDENPATQRVGRPDVQVSDSPRNQRGELKNVIHVSPTASSPLVHLPTREQPERKPVTSVAPRPGRRRCFIWPHDDSPPAPPPFCHPTRLLALL